MIKIRFYSIIIRKDKINQRFNNLFSSFLGPKEEDDQLYAFFTMNEDVLDEIIQKLCKEGGLKGFDENLHIWQDFVVVTSPNFIEGKCDWLKIENYNAEFIG